MLEKIKLLLGITNTLKDSLINLYIEQAQKEIELYTLRPYDVSMDCLVSQMVIEKYNKRFSEGVNSLSVSGINTGYKDGYSKEVMLQLNQLKKKVRLL